MAILLPFYTADAPAPQLQIQSACDCILIQICTMLYLPVHGHYWPWSLTVKLTYAAGAVYHYLMRTAPVATEVWFSCTYIGNN